MSTRSSTTPKFHKGQSITVFTDDAEGGDSCEATYLGETPIGLWVTLRFGERRFFPWGHVVWVDSDEGDA